MSEVPDELHSREHDCVGSETKIEIRSKDQIKEISILGTVSVRARDHTATLEL